MLWTQITNLREKGLEVLFTKCPGFKGSTLSGQGKLQCWVNAFVIYNHHCCNWLKREGLGRCSRDFLMFKSNFTISSWERIFVFLVPQYFTGFDDPLRAMPGHWLKDIWSISTEILRLAYPSIPFAFVVSFSFWELKWKLVCVITWESVSSLHSYIFCFLQVENQEEDLDTEQSHDDCSDSEEAS